MDRAFDHHRTSGLGGQPIRTGNMGCDRPVVQQRLRMTLGRPVLPGTFRGALFYALSAPLTIGPMAFIRYVPDHEAGGLLASLYARYSGEKGSVDNIIRIHSLNPPSMRDHVDLYSHLMRGPSPLTRVQREMIAVTVSAANDCFY